MAAAPLYFLFFCSGVSGLVYQVVWVRQFGNVFGNTVYSSSLVVAIFMLGLGAGSYAVGRWADRQYASAPESLLRAYGAVELVIAAFGLIITFILPLVGGLAATMSSYQPGVHGWFVLTPSSYIGRGAIAVVLLTPITVLMGGTLTLLIRHLVRRDVEVAGGWTIAVLYGVNTAGAAVGAFLTDFVFVPVAGLFATELLAVALNLVAGIGAVVLAARGRVPLETNDMRPAKAGRDDRPNDRVRAADGSRRVGVQANHGAGARAGRYTVELTALALALSGFAALGLEILWLRHFAMLLGGFRAVFSLLLTVILVGIGVGSLAGGAIARRTGRPADVLMAVQALLVIAASAGLVAASGEALRIEALALQASFVSSSRWYRAVMDVFYDMRPMFIEAGVPALLMGTAFPLANAAIQRVESAVGRRAGALYLANTIGGVGGSLVTGFFLLPTVGIQASATWLMAVAGVAILPLAVAGDGFHGRHARHPRWAVPAVAGVLAVAAMTAWMTLPHDFVRRRTLPQPPSGERVVDVSEGVNEIVAVTERPGIGRALMTNGHAMSSTALLDQRYMRALAHIPLLMAERPERVLVIGFGVGNTTDAARLHPSIRRVEVADLSQHILEQAAFFRDANHDVQADSRVAIYVNDGRQHLHMQPEGTYDLITLEPPPIAHAGVGALYSRDFYELARLRLKPGGFISQWLPAYQVTAESSLAMVRAFVEVFPQSVLLSGTQAELVLVGTSGPRIEIEPARLVAALRAAPAVEADLRRVDLATPTEIVGTFVAGPRTLLHATRVVRPSTDDRPVQEYSVRSSIGVAAGGVPASLFDLSEVRAWCPKCFDGETPVQEVASLDTYLALMDASYHAPPAEVTQAAIARGRQRRVLGSAYLGAVLPDSSDVRALVALADLRAGRYDQAIAALREAVTRQPGSAAANRNLGEALALAGRPDAIEYLRRAVGIDPDDAGARRQLGSALIARGEFREAADHLSLALRVGPESAALQNDLGVALASTGRIGEAVDHFERAVTLDPHFAEASRNLAAARQATGRGR